jgi:hypothetical protein
VTVSGSLSGSLSFVSTEMVTGTPTVVLAESGCATGGFSGAEIGEV